MMKAAPLEHAQPTKAAPSMAPGDGGGVKLLDLELAHPLPDLPPFDGYASGLALVRVHGLPIGLVPLERRDDGWASVDIRARLLEQLKDELQAHTPGNAGTPAAGLAGDRGLHEVLHPPPAPHAGPWPSLSVAVCTRDRPEDLEACLASLLELDYPGLEILVVDNAPSDAAAAKVCAAHPAVRYLVEPRPGLDWARNRAALEATGEILAFTDDDVRVDPDWARAIIRPFVEDVDVMAVAGLVVPLELETRAQLVFEAYGGLSGGFRPMKMQGGADWGARGMWHYALMAQQGSGANLAFRRCVFDQVGLFDPALGVGTLTNGGDDTEMLFRVMAEGYAMVYQPSALVRHRHRRTHEEVQRQISGWGSGTYAWLTRSALARPTAAWVLVLFGLRGLLLQGARLARPGDLPRGLMLAELRGALAGPYRYLRARKRARKQEEWWGPQAAESA